MRRHPLVALLSLACVLAGGRPVAPVDAVRIDSTAYGPGHRFLDHATSVRAGRPPA